MSDLANSANRRHLSFQESMRLRRQGLERLQRETRTRSTVALMESRSPTDFLALPDDPRVFCMKDLVRLTGRASEAILLSQLFYWFSPPQNHLGDNETRCRARVMVDDVCWLDQTHGQLATETGLSPTAVKRAIAVLKSSGHIDTKPRADRRSTLLRPSASFGWTELQSDGIKVYGTTVKMVPRPETAIILSQLCYWSGTDSQGRCRLRVHRNGEYWIAKTDDELAGETGLTSRQVRSSIDWLVRNQLVVKEVFRFGGRPTKHLLINAEEFANRWEQQKLLEWSS